MIIAVDCDGVLADFDYAARQAAPLGHGETLEGLYGSDAAMWDEIERLGAAFHHWIRPIDGAREALDWLRSRGHRVICVTAPPKRHLDWHRHRLRWLHWRMGFTPEEVIFTRDKSLIRADVLIDDMPKNLIGFQGKRVLVTQSWNQDFDASEADVRRIPCFNREILKSMAGE